MDAVRPDAEPAADEAPEQPEAMSQDSVSKLWDFFRKGGSVICPRDGDYMAVAVDASIGTYRLVCVACGHATPWFDCRAGIGLRLRGRSSRPPPGGMP